MTTTTLKTLCSTIVVWDNWRINYGKYVPLFIKEAASGAHWKDWDQNVFNEFFMKSSGQCVSSLRQGYFTNDEKEEIKANWVEISPLLQKIALQQDAPSYEVYTELKATVRKYTDYDRRAATHRLIASLQPQLLCTIVNQNKLWELIEKLKRHVIGFDFEWKPTWFENSYQTIQLFKEALGTNDGYQIMTYPWQVYEEYDFSNKNNNNDMSEDKIDEAIALLRYKKQIILQGPPGTGKTRLAKKIAQRVTAVNNATTLTNEEIARICKEPASIPTAKTVLTFKILGVNERGVRVENSEGREYTAPFAEIIKMYHNEAWDKAGVIVNGTDSYSAAVAKYIHSKQEKSLLEEGAGYCKIIQFHPSYSYEDFVRGVVAKPGPEGEGIIYEAENKTLASFAQEALHNYHESQIAVTTLLGTEEQVKTKMARFVTHVINTIDQDGKYMISDNVYIFYVDDKRFKYKGDNWEAHSKGLNMKFSELEKIITAGISERADIVALSSLSALARSHASYYAGVINKYNLYRPQPASLLAKESVPPKNYVLIIDEINRANLSSVLGELIYALEYRGEAVEGMYEVDGEKHLILPPNFYIIGTMNTADRSVGHIDYAVRRRFAFVDVLPEVLQDDEKIYFNVSGFTRVAALFEHNVSAEFDRKEVQIGHSYFIAKKAEARSEAERDEIFTLKMNYEVVPILNEYVRDGILVGEIGGQDIRKYIEGLQLGGK